MQLRRILPIFLAAALLVSPGCELATSGAGGLDGAETAVQTAEAPTEHGQNGAAMGDYDGEAGGPAVAPAPPPYDPDESDVPANQGDDYEPVGTNPFVVAVHDPQSTFAVDVDTASYDIFRRDIGYGWLPHEDGVRLEEFVNYFPYDYEAPAFDAEEPFLVHVEAAPNPLRATTLVRIGIKGADAPPEEKKATNLVFLIDVSGSMTSQHKLPLVKTVLLEALEVLDPEDTVSIVTYAGSVGVRLEPTAVADKDTIVDVIEDLDAGGSTSGAAGIDLAYDQAEAGFIVGGINHVVLCTDGDFNVGPSSDEALVAMIEEKRTTGITLTVLGFGVGNLNDAMMEKVSNAGNGVYGVISSVDQAIDYVHKRLLSALHFIAKDVKIQVDFHADHVLAYRLLGYENRALLDEQFIDDTVDAGEIGAGHTVTALYEVVLTGQAIPQADGAPDPTDGDPFDGEVSVQAGELCRVKIRYKSPDATEDDAARQMEIGLDVDDVMTSFGDADADFKWAVGIAAFAEILKGSPYGDMGHLEQLTSFAAENAGTDPDRAEFLYLLDQALDLLLPEPLTD